MPRQLSHVTIDKADVGYSILFKRYFVYILLQREFLCKLNVPKLFWYPNFCSKNLQFSQKKIILPGFFFRFIVKNRGFRRAAHLTECYLMCSLVVGIYYFLSFQSCFGFVSELLVHCFWGYNAQFWMYIKSQRSVNYLEHQFSVKITNISYIKSTLFDNMR